ncbi:MAG: DUF2243 domain-containing protein [Noviherbaspirillum sp.]
MSATTDIPPPRRFSGRLSWSGYLLGFGLGGFFDGILLHQVLQWHHLLSGLDGPAFRDIRVQILADGLFHALMYVIAAAGLWCLWKARRDYAEPGADRLLLANAMIGFGIWHILDSILSHWILGIHRIRMAAENVLFWDILWFIVFGVAFLVAGWMLRKRPGIGGPGHRGAASALALALAVAIAGPVAALPPAGATTVMVFFRPGITPGEVSRAIDAVDGRILWAAGSGDVWALDVKDTGRTSLLYRHGAYLVSNSALAIGCLAWTAAVPGSRAS